MNEPKINPRAAWPFPTGEAPPLPIADAAIFRRIIDWNVAAGNTDKGFNVRQSALYAGLQCEELAEKLKAIGFGGDVIRQLEDLGHELKQGVWDQIVARGNLKDMLDGDMDLIVVSIGAAMSQGADAIGAMEAVIRSNDSKRFPDGKLHKDTNGKILKGPDYRPVDLTPYVYQQALKVNDR